MREYILLFCLFLAGWPALGQEEEYYKAPEKRMKSYEVENLPHLESAFSSFYIGLSGGLRKPYHRYTGNFGDFGENSSTINEWAELNLGLNMNNAYFLETGLVRMKNHFTTQMYSAAHWPAFLVSMRSQQWYIPVVVKKRLFSMNRVTRNADVNLGVGGGFLVATRPAASRGYAFTLPLQDPDIEEFRVTLSQSASPIYGGVSAELKGNVTERLELLVFFKGIFRKPGYLSHAFDVTYTGSNVPVNWGVFERSGSLVFGLQARFNSRKFYRYTSRL